MIRCRSLSVTIACAVLSGTLVASPAAHAAISFVAAEPIAAPADPNWVVMTDLDRDDRADTIVVANNSHQMSVLLGDTDSSSRFTPATVLTFGNELGPPAAGDLNGDNNVDVAVPDHASKGVWIMLGLGNGSFLQPYLVQVGRTPSGVAIANFDGVRNNDLAITDKQQGRIFVRLNDGQTPPQFPSGPDFQIGEKPTVVVAADFSNDGHPDIAALNTGGPRGKDVGVLIFERLAAGFPVFLPVTNYIAASKPLELLVSADFNGDGVADLALLDRPTQNSNRLATIMLSRGDGVFLAPRPFEIVCPFFTGGIACDVTNMAAGDFDDNGNVDLAILLSDPRRFSTTDAVQVYGGRGDGGFGSASVTSVPKRPISIGAADIDGDDAIDLVIGARRDTGIQIAMQAFINVSTAGELPNGELCILGDECASGRCTNGRCCATTCFDFERCDVPGSEGVCVPVVEPIDCTADADCPGACRDEPFRSCESGGDCNTGDTCDARACRNFFCCDPDCSPLDSRCDVPGFEGVCIPKSEIGSECAEDADCQSIFCRDGFCCNEECVNGICDQPGEEGVCQPRLPLGEFCGDDVGDPDDTICASGICDFFDLICCDAVCTVDEFCSEDGFCTPFEDPATPTPTRDPSAPTDTPGGAGTPTPTRTQVPAGGFCEDDDDCNSTNCVNEVCCLVDECADDQHCQPGTGNCVEGPPPATRTRTSTPTPTATPLPGECPDGFEPVGNDCVAVSRSGGCSTSDSGPRGGDLLGIALLPLALSLGRRWQRRLAAVRVRRGR